ncbi:MAG: UDP-glucose 4-epimerase GalE [Desulfuromonas sp.]|nr:MAG: UDP-glucose 4-epimerase GalE [Desulfuromonas sp.]
MNILVCGGAGYIGSHMVKMLAEEGHQVTTFDNLSTGFKSAVQWGALTEGDLLDRKALKNVFKTQEFDAVMHFSARSLVGESFENPAFYYQNNVVGTYNLLEAMCENGVKTFVFSSTAATFGIPIKDLIDETHPQIPISPYGKTKVAVEQMLNDFFSAYGLNSVSLRYFNAAGADPSGLIGEAHVPETHLIPNVLKSAAGDKPILKVFGNNYPTKDGTCVRDYIHVNDLCKAHLLALDYMAQQPGAHGFNLGNGQGFSILEVIRAASEVTQKTIPYEILDRRPGDPPILVSDSSRARRLLGWDPVYTELRDIIATAWHWHKNNKTVRTDHPTNTFSIGPAT